VSYLYRVSRFHVGRKPSRRRLWTRYHTVPAVVGGYAFLSFFLMTVGFIAFVEFCRFFHAGIRHIAFDVARILQTLNH
jgi:hypothetical protein